MEVLHLNFISFAPYQIHETPLFVACGNGHCDVVNMLLGVGADVKMARSNVRI